MCEPVSAIAAAELLSGAGLGAGVLSTGAAAAGGFSAMSALTAASLAGTAVSAAGQIQQGRQAKAVAGYNAQMDELKAKDAITRGVIASDQKLAEVRQIEGKQTAAMGASGATLGEGTLGSVLDQTATLGTLDADQIYANAQKAAWGFKTEADLTRAQGSAAESAGMLGGFGTLLTGGAQAYGMYKRTKNNLYNPYGAN